MFRIPCLAAVVMLAAAVVCYQQDAVNVWYEFVSPGASRVVSPAPADHTEFMTRQRNRNAVGREVLAGRMSLVEAAAECHRINGPRSAEIVRWLPGDSLEERLCQQVVNVVWSFESTGGLPAPVSERLLVQLETLRREGALVW
jgi:hypothetical protein